MRSILIAIPLLIPLSVTGLAQQGGASGSNHELDPSVVAKIEQLGGKVMRVAQNDPGVEVSFHLGRNREGLRSHDEPQPGDPKPPPIDVELEVLGRLDSLLSLHLGGTDVTDAGLAHLAGLTSLTRLHLERTAVSDDGLAQLGQLGQLRYLNLYGTGVTDAGLRHLEGLKSLASLYLWQTQVTPDGVEKLQAALPECEINLGWDEPASAEEEVGTESEAEE